MEEETRPQNIVIGQPVQEGKRVLSREMRREMTKTESMLWLRLRRNGLGVHFRRQQIIDGFIADFYCHEAALVVEVDGPIHDAEYDRERDRLFSVRGIFVLRFQSQDVEDRIGWVISCTRRALENQLCK